MANTTGTPAAQYEEAQRDEVSVLGAIYASDFVLAKSKNVWSRQTEKSFSLTLRASWDEGTTITINVTLPVTYPKSVPVMAIKQSSVRSQTLEAIKHVMKTRPSQLVGQVMIHDIASEIQDLLEVAGDDQASASQLESLIEERAKEEAAASQAARLKAEELERRAVEARRDERETVQKLRDEELRRKQLLRPQSKSEEIDEDTSRADVIFDRVILFKGSSDIYFRGIEIVEELADGPLTKVFKVLPCAVTKTQNRKLLVLKQAVFRGSCSKSAVQDLETTLDRLKEFGSPNMLKVLEFRVQHETSPEVWRFDILTEHASRGSLLDMLELTEVLPTSRSKSFAAELLAALEYLHSNGLSHGRVHAGNVMIYASETTGFALKLGDGSFQHTLYKIRPAKLSTPATSRENPNTWTAPEVHDDSQQTSRKTDVWDLGNVLVQMLFGLQEPRRYQTTKSFINSRNLSVEFSDFLKRVFDLDQRRRPSPFELRAHEFLIRTSAPVLSSAPESSPPSPLVSRSLTNYFEPSLANRMRRESSSYQQSPQSRWIQDWDDLGKLGAGGFGQVLKARNKLDGGLYAIKRIVHRTSAELHEVLSEVALLARLNHPFVVRYYGAWSEEESKVVESEDGEGSNTGNENHRGNDQLSVGTLQASFAQSSHGGGLDFLSASGNGNIEFALDSDEDEDGLSQDASGSGSSILSHEESPPKLNIAKAQTESSSGSSGMFAFQSPVSGSAASESMRPRSASRVQRSSTLYIQMEFCERLTLRTKIRGLNSQDRLDENWRIFKQIVEGLEHIHSHGFIHRDLKPENIFLDKDLRPKIGDFGLATTGQSFALAKASNGQADGDEMTSQVGTYLYVAPEILCDRSYTNKVDMYSLGIIFFEMWWSFSTDMERIMMLNLIRKKEHSLPESFDVPDRRAQKEIILGLISHRPSERPSCTELLKSGKIPSKVEEALVKLLLDKAADPSSPYHHDLVRSLFIPSARHEFQEQMWESKPPGTQSTNIEYALLSEHVVEKLIQCFRCHGAVQVYRPGLFPRSPYYTSQGVVQILNESGNLLQMPHDLTMPNARIIARSARVPEKTFTFGLVYRDKPNQLAPFMIKEADFDVVTYDRRHLRLKEAEVIKVMDEILERLPCYDDANICYHISHCGLLDLILQYCQITDDQAGPVKKILGRLNIGDDHWGKIRSELRAPEIGVSSTSLDDLAQFDFRDSIEKALSKLQSIFSGSVLASAVSVILTQLASLFQMIKDVGVRRKLFLSPLSNFNEHFYTGEVMFQCLFNGKKRDVIAAGGRYDRLVERHRNNFSLVAGQQPKAYAVGINIAWERFVTSMARFQRDSLSMSNRFIKKSEVAFRRTWKIRRCEVLVASFDPVMLQSTGMRICADLWGHDISAEIAVDASQLGELEERYREEKHSWWVIIKQDMPGLGRAELRVKNRAGGNTGGEVEMRSTELVEYLAGEIRERDLREATSELETGKTNRHSALSRADSHGTGERTVPDVQVLLASHKSKKSNKYSIVNAAQNRVAEACEMNRLGPVVALETKDEILEKVKYTRLSDPDTWRRLVQEVSPNEREYLQELQGVLLRFKESAASDVRKAWLYNFRTELLLDYDLHL